MRNYWQFRIRRPSPLFSLLSPFSLSPFTFFSFSLFLSPSFYMSRGYSLTNTFSEPRNFSFLHDEFRHSTLKVISTITVFQAARWELQLTNVFSSLLYWQHSAYTPLCIHVHPPGSGSDCLCRCQCEDALPRHSDKRRMETSKHDY